MFENIPNKNKNIPNTFSLLTIFAYPIIILIYTYTYICKKI